jgi:hypothetical protein
VASPTCNTAQIGLGQYDLSKIDVIGADLAAVKPYRCTVTSSASWWLGLLNEFCRSSAEDLGFVRRRHLLAAIRNTSRGTILANRAVHPSWGVSVRLFQDPATPF